MEIKKNADGSNYKDDYADDIEQIENNNRQDREICKKCLSGEIEIFCEVCNYR